MLVPLELLLSLVYGCPANLAPCKCTPPTVPGSRPILDCSALTEANQFSAIPGLNARPPVHYDQIIIRRSQLDILPAHAFGTSHANEYVIENNPMLEGIEPRAFGPNPNPKVLSIRSNPLLDSIPWDDVQTFNNLEILRLNDNRLTEVPDNAFDKMSDKLREIHLQRNVILDMGPFAFRGLKALEIVDLSENQLIEVPAGGLYFDKTPKLVDLSRNKIIGLDSEAFLNPGNPQAEPGLAMHINLANNNIQGFQQQEYQAMFQKFDALKTALDPPPAIDPTQALLAGANSNLLVERLFSQLRDPGNLGPERTQLLASLLGLNNMPGLPTTPTVITTTTTTTTPAPVTQAAPASAPGAAALGGNADFASIISRVLALRAQHTGAAPPPELQALLGTLTTTTTASPTPEIPSSTLPPTVVPSSSLDPLSALRQRGFDLSLFGPQSLGQSFSPVFQQPATTTPVPTTTTTLPPPPPVTAPPQPVLQAAPAIPESVLSSLSGGNQEALLAFLSSRFDLVPRSAAASRPSVANPVQSNVIPEVVTPAPPPPPPPSTTTTTEAPTPPPSPSPIVELASAPQTAPEPQVSPAVDPNLDSIKELKDRLLSAIRSNPEAAAVAAAAIRDAAKASSRSGATGTSASALEALSSLSGLRGGNRVKRRAKRQTMPPTETKPNYSIDFTGNPLNCNCELKWLFDFGYKYSDQFFGLACGGNKRDLFSLPSTHFSRC